MPWPLRAGYPRLRLQAFAQWSPTLLDRLLNRTIDAPVVFLPEGGTPPGSLEGPETGKIAMPTGVFADTPPESLGPKSAWPYFLVLHLDHFATLVCYLVADPTLVECVMTRAVARLESTPFDASDALVTYTQARRTLIEEAMAVLNRCEGLSRRSGRRSSATRPTFKGSHPY